MEQLQLDNELNGFDNLPAMDTTNAETQQPQVNNQKAEVDEDELNALLNMS